MKKTHLSKEILNWAHSLLIEEYWINPDLIKTMSWDACSTDDKQIFGENAENLASAMRSFGIESFYIVPVFDLMDTSITEQAAICNATAEAIEFFQSSDEWIDWSISECVFFDENRNFLLFRTGDCVHTICAGSFPFIEIACKNKKIWQIYKGPPFNNN